MPLLQQFKSRKETSEEKYSNLRRNPSAEDLVVDLAGAKNGELLDPADFVEAHDAAEAGTGEEGAGIVFIGRESGGERFLEGGEGDHFATGLEEALKASGKVDETFFVEKGEIAGDVPALSVMLVEGTGAIVMEITGKDGGAMDEQKSALTGGQRLHRIGINDADLDAIERPSPPRRPAGPEGRRP